MHRFISPSLWEALCCVVLMLAACAMVSPGAAQDFDPLDPAALQRTSPKLDPNADAEYLLRKTKIEDRVYGGDNVVLIYSNYVRLKIYTERGKERYSTIDLAVGMDGTLSDLKARTILPDGRVVPLEKDAIFERDVKRPNGRTVRRRSFTMPAVEVGAVLEYQWRQTYNNRYSDNLHLDVQQEEPAWQVTFELKPIDFSKTRFVDDLRMGTRAFQCEHPGWSRVGHEWYGATFTDVAAFREEMYMPPEDQLRAWLLVFYQPRIPIDGKKFWREFNKKHHAKVKLATKVDDRVGALAREVVTGIDNPEEKARRLAEYCRTKVKNIYHPLYAVSSADIGSWKPITKPSETLDRGMGTGDDIAHLFIALSQAVGLDARQAWMVGRDQFVFEPDFPHDHFMNRASVAVKIGQEWKFFDPSNPFLPPGMLSWPEEGVQALIVDPKEPQFANTPMSEPERTTDRSTGKFTLSPEGDLSGTVELTHEGYTAITERTRFIRKTAEERILQFEEDWKDRYAAAKLSNIEILHVEDVTKPLTIRYRVEIPGYAQRTGKRMFVAPAVFQRAKQPLFTASERRYPIYFYHAWREMDSVSIELPEGYVLDAADAPESFPIGEAGEFKVKMRLLTAEGKRTLLYERLFEMGRGGRLLFPREAYPALKQVGEVVRQADNHLITVRQQDSAGGQ
jgi:transglutaminase-like putative cysteine protease